MLAQRIKEESSSDSDCSDSSCNSKRCTCKTSELKKQKQVLVSFGLSRKKVFTLNGKIKLHDLFKSYVLSEPAFSGLLKDSYVVFQEYSEKFKTWVDVDNFEALCDGAVLKAVFFPCNIERDETNPGDIRRRESIETNVKGAPEIIDISDGESNNDTAKKQNKKFKKTVCENTCTPEKNSVQEEKAASSSNTKKPTLKKKKKKDNLEVSNKSQNTMEQDVVDTEKLPAKLPAKVPAHPKGPEPNTQRTSSPIVSQSGSNETSEQESWNWNQPANQSKDIDAVGKLQSLCKYYSWDNPEYTYMNYGSYYICKVTVNGVTYMGTNKLRSQVKKAAAESALEGIAHRPHEYQNSSGYRNNYGRNGFRSNCRRNGNARRIRGRSFGNYYNDKYSFDFI